MRSRPATYALEMKPHLPGDAFERNPWRLLWLPLHLGVIGVAIALLGSRAIPLYLAPAVSVLIGLSFAALTFLGHEVMHGSVVRSHGARNAIGWLAFLPFTLSPRLWIAWHNRVHHAHANAPGIDPDANPTLHEYRGSRRIRMVTDHFAIGRRNATGVIGLLVGFSAQCAHVLSFAGRRDYVSRRAYQLALLETALGLTVWAAVLFTIGPVAFVFAFLLPLIVANVVVMSFIFTNHSLSPLSHDNDALSSALSVTTPRLVEWLTLGFGYHVEHHLFPSMSASKGPMLRALLVRLWPDRYQSMPLWRALLTMHRTGRVYRDDTTLHDPRTGRSWEALRERESSLGSMRSFALRPDGVSSAPSLATVRAENPWHA